MTIRDLLGPIFPLAHSAKGSPVDSAAALPFLDGVEGYYPGGGPKAAIHSGLDSALGSHPCVALSSYQAPPLYGGCPNIAQQKSSTLEENCDKSWGVWGAKPLKELPPEMRDLPHRFRRRQPET